VLPPLPESAITIGGSAETWRDAVRLAGDALARSGATTPAFANEMIRVIEEFGPYVVIAPGLALAHARPGPETLSNGLAVVTLAEPVPFGHAHNDPVRVVLGLSVTHANSHIETVAELANIFNNESAIPRLAAARTVDEVLAVMNWNGETA
jgi:PTS system ascorbate-specific IIA component